MGNDIAHERMITLNAIPYLFTGTTIVPYGLVATYTKLPFMYLD